MHTQTLMSMVAAGAIAAGLPTIAAAQDIQAEVVRLQDWNYDQLYAEGISVEQLLDAEVSGPTGDEIGDVENVVFGKDGKVLSIIAEIGGFLEIGDTHVNIPWDQVRVGAEADEITVPLTQETIEEYSLFADPLLTATEATTEVQAVEGDNAGVALTGLRAWRATEVIGDYARLREGEGFTNYGYVDDLIIRNGEIAAVVVGADVGWGTPGMYAYPYYGYGYGWRPGLGYYDLPYSREDVGTMRPFDHERFDS